MTHILTTATHALGHLGHGLIDLLGSIMPTIAPLRGTTALVQLGLTLAVQWWAGK